MTRKLHERDVCELSDGTLQDELDSHLSGNVLVLAVEDARLQSLLPISGQTLLVGNHLEFGDDATVYTAPLHDSKNEQLEWFPQNKKERFHFGTNTFDTLVTFFPKAGYFQRGPAFMDMTRIVRPGGTLIAVTGLQPEKPADHDAKWWVPHSDDATLDAIRIIRHEEFKTPILMSIFTVTSDSARHPDATVVTNTERMMEVSP